MVFQPGYFMHGMEYPPGGPIWPDIIRPTGANPVGKWKNHFGFVHFSRSAVPSSFPKGTWTRRILHPVKYAGQCQNGGEIDWREGKFDRPFAKIYWRLSKIW
jgi:hypothetical protein